MKIIVGGASNVGKSIVGYLALGNNDIIIVDTDAKSLEEISKEYDVQPVLGSISNPNIQEKIGMDKADMLIAVTESDEINLIACQVAYTLFDVKIKIARIDSEYFLNPLWNNLYNEKSLPVDMVITPDIEISNYILDILNLPNSTGVYKFIQNNLNIFSFKYSYQEAGISKYFLKKINDKLQDLSARIVLIMRDNKCLPLLNNEDIFLQKNDVVYISCRPENNIEVLNLFGINHNQYEKVVIFGGNSISYNLASNIEKDGNISNCSIIEDDEKKAQYLADRLSNTSVIVGEMMSDAVLDDSGFNNADVSIAITDKDKDNLLLSLIASKNRNVNAISLINSSDYSVLSSNISNHTILDRSVITISGILRYLRKARISKAYSLGRSVGEIWEIRLGDDSTNIDKLVTDIKIPQNSSIMAIWRNNDIIYDINTIYLQANDKILIYVSPNDIRQIESIFYM